MPMEYDRDPLSTLGNHVHFGAGAAGNKGMLSYRHDMGSPGYTGYCPSYAAVVLPLKAPHTGKPVEPVDHMRATLSTLAPERTRSKATEYQDVYRKVPADTKAFSKTGGGYFLANRKLIETPPFIATSTYKAEVLNAPETSASILDKSVGLKCTLPQYEVAREGMHKRSQSAEPSQRMGATARPGLKSTARPTTALTTAGELVGYQTTAGSMFVRDPKVGGNVAPGAVARAQADGTAAAAAAAAAAADEPRYTVMPRAMPPTMFGAASGTRYDFGEDASDPLDRAAPNERFQTRLATTRDLSEGTTRNTNHLPGYTGHQPASKYHELARAQADAADERMNAKNDMCLYHLDQFTRTRLPGYTGYKPQNAKNISLEQPSQGPTTLTTTGAAQVQAMKAGMPAVDNTHYNNSRNGIMNFFNSNGVQVSDNGLSNAQLYYKYAAPGDGRFKHSLASKTTPYGATFNNRSSLV